MKNKIKSLVENKNFKNFILVIIILNSLLIGLDTSDKLNPNLSNLINLFDNIFTIVFIIELSLRIYAYRLRFFRYGWNIFDFIVILSCIIFETGLFSIFRMFRIVKVLRLVSVIPKMRIASQALLMTLPSMLGIAVLLITIYYIYAVITVHLYGKTFPQWFGSIGESFYSLFQIMTFESWSMGIVRPVMEVYPHAWLVFVSFILIATYMILNIAIGIIVECVGEIKKSEKYQCDETEELLKKVDSLQKEISEIKELIKNKKI